MTHDDVENAANAAWQLTKTIMEVVFHACFIATSIFLRGNPQRVRLGCLNVDLGLSSSSASQGRSTEGQRYLLQSLQERICDCEKALSEDICVNLRATAGTRGVQPAHEEVLMRGRELWNVVSANSNKEFPDSRGVNDPAFAAYLELGQYCIADSRWSTDAMFRLGNAVRTEHAMLRMCLEADRPKTPGEMVVVAFGFGTTVLAVGDPAVEKFALNVAETRVFSCFILRISKHSPNEVVPWDELQEALDGSNDDSDPEGRMGAKAKKQSAELRDLFSKLQKRLKKWRSTPDRKPWFGTERRNGRFLNKSIEWILAAGEGLMDLESSRSPRIALIDARKCAELTPNPTDRLPARRHGKSPTTDDSDFEE